MIFELYAGVKMDIFPYLAYAAIFTFSLLSPETNEKYDIWVATYLIPYLRKHLKNKNPKYIQIILIFVGIIATIFLWFKII